MSTMFYDWQVLMRYQTDNTNFTFLLTQIPDELKIKIYTVAGRLIKVLETGSSQLKTNFNSIAWDGRDEDGDLIANISEIINLRIVFYHT